MSEGEKMIEGIYKKTIFSSDNGYIVGLLKVTEYDDSTLCGKTITFTGYFTDIDSISIDDYYIHEYLQDPLSPYGYRIHYNGGPTWQYPACLSPEDLNYYLVEALKLVNELKPVGKEIICVTNAYYEYVPIGYYLGFHHYTFKYGKFNCNGGGSWM